MPETANRPTSISRAPSADWIADHRRIWRQKAMLRAVYTRWFTLLRETCRGDGPIVELGCGPGLFKEIYPEIIATDVVDNPHADRIVDATALPFGDGEVGSILMIDVFHHLPDPQRFLREVDRVLSAGGRLIMIEPWLGLAGRILWTYVHHEDCDPSVDPASPWSDATKEPMMGNAALPYLYFSASGHLDAMGTDLRVLRREPFCGLPWLLSGGFQPLSFWPAAMTPVAEALDRLLSRAPRLTASRCLVVVEKRR